VAVVRDIGVAVGRAVGAGVIATGGAVSDRSAGAWVIDAATGDEAMGERPPATQPARAPVVAAKQST
jgi:hypothetical protein